MRATTPDMRMAAPSAKIPGRQFSHVPTTSTSEGTAAIMPFSTDIRIPAPRQPEPEPEHQPWCVSHLPDEGGGMCISADITLPGQIVGLTFRPGEGVQVSLCTGDHIDIVTVDEAERRAYAVLAQVAVARAHTVSPSLNRTRS